MSAIKDGGPAFPFMEYDGDGNPYLQNEGATLRDYFAAKAMQGFFNSKTATEAGQKAYGEDVAAYAVRAYIARCLRRTRKADTVPASPDRDSLDRVWAEVQARMRIEVPSAYPTPTQAGGKPAKE